MRLVGREVRPGYTRWDITISPDLVKAMDWNRFGPDPADASRQKAQSVKLLAKHHAQALLLREDSSTATDDAGWLPLTLTPRAAGPQRPNSYRYDISVPRDLISTLGWEDKTELDAAPARGRLRITKKTATSSKKKAASKKARSA